MIVENSEFILIFDGQSLEPACFQLALPVSTFTSSGIAVGWLQSFTYLGEVACLLA